MESPGRTGKQIMLGQRNYIIKGRVVIRVGGVISQTGIKISPGQLNYIIRRKGIMGGVA